MKAPDPTDIQSLYGPTAMYKRVWQLQRGDVLIIGRAGENVRCVQVRETQIIGSRVRVTCWDGTVQTALGETWAIVSV